ALTKVDLVDPDVVGLVRLEVEEFLRGSFLEGAPIVAVSSRTGQGVEELKQALLGVANEVSGKDALRYFRLPIDRAFQMKGFGTVVTGTLVAGQVQPEDEEELFPARRRGRVRGVQSGGRAVERAMAGQRAALNLAGVELANVERGMVLASPGRFEATRRLDARVILLPSARRIRNHSRVHFHQGTAERVAEVVLLEQAELGPGQSAFAQLRLDDRVLVLPGDHFILRQFSPVETIGGGVVLDALAPRHRQRDTHVLPYLATLERGSPEETLAARVRAAPLGVELNGVVARSGWLEKEARETLAKLAQAGIVRIVSQSPFVVISMASFDEAVGRIRAEIEAFHRANPLIEGIAREDLRSRAMAQGRPEVFRAA